MVTTTSSTNDVRSDAGSDVLSKQRTISANAADPTKTKTIRRRYAQRLRGWLRRLSARVREGVDKKNIFAINEADPTSPPVFNFPRDDQQIEAFMNWLRRQERRGFLDIVNRDENVFIRSSYQRGLGHADRALRDAGMNVRDTDIERIFNMPVHKDAVQALFTRNYNELQGITEAMNQQIARELSEGFVRGENPRKIARRITDRVDAVGKHRATVLARTEVIRAHSEATLNRFEQMGVENVTVKAEWSTAGDRRVCPICESLEGNVYTTQEARTGTFSFDGSSYSQQPPAHPQCRCALLPVTS